MTTSPGSSSFRHKPERRKAHSDGARRSGSGRRRSFFKGTPVVPGIAIGRVHLKFRKTQMLSDRTLATEEVPRELEILAEAVRQTKERLLVDRAKVAKQIGEVEASIFDAHIALLEDRTLLSRIRQTVQNDLRPVDVVVAQVVEGYYQAMSMVQDEHLRERAADIRDVGLRLLDSVHLLKEQAPLLEKALVAEVPAGDIVFARELLPSDIATLESRHVAGVVTEAGSTRGHCAVMLRSLNIPTVMGVDGLVEVLSDGDLLVVDGSTGSVLINPREDALRSYRNTLKDFQGYRQELASEADLPARTTDGVEVTLLANIAKRAELDLANLYRMDGVGLYRTEFPLMVRDSFPDEEEMVRLYGDLAKAVGDRQLVVRTMDLGTDKQLSYLKLPQEQNSALGRRSIRLSFDLEEFQLTQLRAILRISPLSDVRLLFPFITSVEDVRMAKRMLRQAQRQLDARSIPYNKEMRVGMMVEVPAAALSIEKFVREVDFFSVGTNDLVQYVCAADRNNPDVSPWYKGYNPGVLVMLRDLVERVDGHNRSLTVCGEMAGDPFYTMFLIGIGVRRLSMSAPQAPLVKKIVRSINLSGAKRLAERALQYSSTSQIRQLFEDTVQQILGRDLSVWTKQQE